ncbi:uncharacterized protein [Diadema antillarum]|uniref:uncharacterized protein n=1 Tax=Diadema antillarum TaxID=105358 RepID=UPI003A8A135A
MSQFKAKYQALQILQRMAAGDISPTRASRQSLSPRKPGIKTSDDILKEKYAELAELMAVQQLEKQAVSALKKLCVNQGKDERASRRRTRNGEKGRRRKGRADRDRDDMQRQRPQSASSVSSQASHSSARSSSSGASHSSRHSSNSNASRSSSRSNASSASKSSTKSSSPPKPIERTFVTIIEEEEEEEIVNQDEIKERQVVMFDAEIARDNEEEAERKKESTKRTRRVSFVLEAQDASSEEEVDDVFDGEDRNDLQKDRISHDDSEIESKGGESSNRTPRYIEIENSILRDILSPRSPQHRSFSTGEQSSRKSRSKSPRRKKRSSSPRRAWESADGLQLPPRPKREVSPSDHRLCNTDNPEIKKWLRHKNALIRRQRRAERIKEQEEERAARAAASQREEKVIEAEKSYNTWSIQKQSQLQKRRREEKMKAREERKQEEEERQRREQIFKERQRMSVSAFGEKVPAPGVEKKKRKKRSKQKYGQGKKVPADKDGGDKKSDEKDSGKAFSGQRACTSQNPLKGMSYDEWLRQKLIQEERTKRQPKPEQDAEAELSDVIPKIAKDRINRAKEGKGKRVDSGLKHRREELPECDQPPEPKARPYEWVAGSMGSKPGSPRKENHRGRHRPPRKSTARDKFPGSLPTSDSTNSRHSRMFKPPFARPEPQGSESNDDHSEQSAKGQAYKQKSSKKEGSTSGGNKDKVDLPNALVKYTGSSNQNNNVVDEDDSHIFMTEFSK